MKERDDLQAFEFGSSHPPTVTHVRRGRRRWLVIALACLLAVGAGGGYLYYFERERLSRWLEDTPLAPAPRVTQVYKWRDADGTWQITDRPPPAGTPYETLRYRSDENVMPIAPRDD